jgi:hypothetical protein
MWNAVRGATPNERVQATAASVRCAPASGGGSCRGLDGVPYTMSQHGASLRESAEFPTGVKEALAMCGMAGSRPGDRGARAPVGVLVMMTTSQEGQQGGGLRGE